MEKKTYTFTFVKRAKFSLVHDNKKIEVSTTFSLPVTFHDGTKGEYVLIGKEGKVGILVGSGNEGEAVATKFIANKPDKYMWHF